MLATSEGHNKWPKDAGHPENKTLQSGKNLFMSNRRRYHNIYSYIVLLQIYLIKPIYTLLYDIVLLANKMNLIVLTIDYLAFLGVKAPSKKSSQYSYLIPVCLFPYANKPHF